MTKRGRDSLNRVVNKAVCCGDNRETKKNSGRDPRSVPPGLRLNRNVSPNDRLRAPNGTRRADITQNELRNVTGGRCELELDQSRVRLSISTTVGRRDGVGGRPAIPSQPRLSKEAGDEYSYVMRYLRLAASGTN